MILFDYGTDKISFEIKHTSIPLTEAQKEDVENFWKSKTASNPSLFNGDQFSVNSVFANQNSLRICLNKTCYKHNLWMRQQPHKTPGYMILGTGVYVYDDDGLYLVRRQNVATNSGKIASVAGCVDYDSNVNSQGFFEYLKLANLKELEEEVTLENEPSMDDLKYLGLVHEDEDTIFRFRFLLKGKIINTVGDENSEVITVRWSDLVDFYEKYINNLNKSDQSFIKYYFMDKEVWKN